MQDIGHSDNLWRHSEMYNMIEYGLCLLSASVELYNF